MDFKAYMQRMSTMYDYRVRDVWEILRYYSTHFSIITQMFFIFKEFRQAEYSFSNIVPSAC